MFRGCGGHTLKRLAPYLKFPIEYSITVRANLILILICVFYVPYLTYMEEKTVKKSIKCPLILLNTITYGYHTHTYTYIHIHTQAFIYTHIQFLCTYDKQITLKLFTFVIGWCRNLRSCVKKHETDPHCFVVPGFPVNGVHHNMSGSRTSTHSQKTVIHILVTETHVCVQVRINTCSI